MNAEQELWWRQAKSDYHVFELLKRTPGVEPCHLLHYLQMATEKLSKAYLWRAGKPPPKAHTGFVKLLKAVFGRHPGDDGWAAKALGFDRPEDAAHWLRGSLEQFGYPLQNLAPDLCLNGPNPEYPWPHEGPTQCPAGYDFELWGRLRDTGQGRKFVNLIELAVDRFPKYA